MAIVMEEAKQKHVDQFSYTMSLAVLSYTEALSLNMSMLNMFLLSNLFQSEVA